jgi:nucleoside-diphosphate-sugar epimerase
MGMKWLEWITLSPEIRKTWNILPGIRTSPLSAMMYPVSSLYRESWMLSAFHTRLLEQNSPLGYELPIQTMKAGALGTHTTLGVARAQNARFLLASTSEIYGDPLEHPQTESYWGHVDPIGIRSVYDEAKRFAEALTMAYHRFHGIDTRVVRIFNTYGPRMHLDDGGPQFQSRRLQRPYAPRMISDRAASFTIWWIIRRLPF